MGAVEAECSRLDLRQAGVALSAGKLLGKDQCLVALHMGFDNAVAFTQRRLYGLSHPARFGVRPDDQAVNDQLDVMPLLPVQAQVAHLFQHEDLAVHSDTDESRLTGGLKYVFMLAFLAANLGRHQRYPAPFFKAHDSVDDLGYGLPFNGAATFVAVRKADPGE